MLGIVCCFFLCLSRSHVRYVGSSCIAELSFLFRRLSAFDHTPPALPPSILQLRHPFCPSFSSIKKNSKHAAKLLQEGHRDVQLEFTATKLVKTETTVCVVV